MGEVNKNKNHRTAVEAIARLCNPNIYYVICGRGPLLEEHKNLARHLGIADRVIFTGYRENVADFYQMADIFLFPSFREGLPVAVMEAMASGLPVIATRIRGSSDLVSEENLFEPTDVKGIAKAIEEGRLQSVNQKADEFDIREILCLMKEIYNIHAK